MQLAEAAQNSTGIFYDERTNRRVMHHLHTLKKENINQNKKPASPKTKPISNAFADFDFSEENILEREEQ